MLTWEPSKGGGALPAGTIPKTVYYLQHYSGSQLAGGGIEQIMVQPPNPLIALIGKVAIFLIAAYGKARRIEIPFPLARPRGARRRCPIRIVSATHTPCTVVPPGRRQRLVV